MTNLAQAQQSSLMPSPLNASGPQNEMERNLQQLIQTGLRSGQPVEYASPAEFARSMRERSAARVANASR
jgi:hypothetical protein